jgi:hypothetical protein
VVRLLAICSGTLGGLEIAWVISRNHTGKREGLVNGICATQWFASLERFPIPWNRKTSLDLCFIAFSSREPVSTSLEHAVEFMTSTVWSGIRKEVLDFSDASAGEKRDKAHERPDLKPFWYRAFPCFNDI